MHYVIYPDTLLLENFICNLLLLEFLKPAIFPAATGNRIFLASFATAACNTMASLLFFRSSWILQLGVLFPAAGLMVCGCMEIKDGRRILYLLYQMILWTLALGGILQFVEQWIPIRINTLLLLSAFFTIVFGSFEKVRKIYKRQNDCMREIVLYWNGQSQHMQGFADTGNHLFDPISQKPVCIISRDAWNALIADSAPPTYHPVPYKSVGKKDGILWGAQIDYLVILEGNDSQIVDKPMIAITEQPFTGIFHYSILLHNDYC